jgi:hypothetical protein
MQKTMDGFEKICYCGSEDGEIMVRETHGSRRHNSARISPLSSEEKYQENGERQENSMRMATEASPSPHPRMPVFKQRWFRRHLSVRNPFGYSSAIPIILKCHADLVGP